MTTASDLVAATHRHLEGGGRQPLNRLNADINSSTQVVPLTYTLDGAQANSWVTVDLEVMYVWSVSTSDNTLTVQRGMLGSTPASHTAGGLVQVNPRFSDWEIFQALNSEFRSLSMNGIYQIRTLDLTAVSGQEGYDFAATDFLSVADIRWQVPGTVSKEWDEITDYTVNHNLPTGTFPSGTALFFNAGLPSAQQPVRVRYRSSLGLLAALTDNVESVTGLPATAIDIPPLGAAIRLMAARPIGRAQYDAQGDTRRPDEVRVGDVLQAPAGLRLTYQQRVADEARRLGQQWPNRLKARITL